MAKQIKYWDADREEYEDSNLSDWHKNHIDDLLKPFQIINIETLEKVIRFWYNAEK